MQKQLQKHLFDIPLEIPGTPLERPLERGYTTSSELIPPRSPVPEPHNLQQQIQSLHQTLQIMEKKHEAFIMEFSQKTQFVLQKHIEQKKLEESIQTLIDRQNNLLKGYEVRLLQLQKLLTEKESQNLSLMAELKYWRDTHSPNR